MSKLTDPTPGSWESYPVRELHADFWGEWDDLNSKQHGRHPLLDSRFVRPLLSFFGTGREWIVTCRRDGRLVGAAILRLRKTGRWQSFLPSQTQMAPVLAPDLSTAIGFSRHLPGLALSVDFLCQDPNYSPFLPGRDCQSWSRTPYANTMAIDLQCGFDSYWQGRSRNLKKNIARYIRRAEQAGLSSQLDRISSDTALRAAVARYGAIESQGWKGREGTAVDNKNVQGAFYTEVIERFARTGNAEVFELRLNDRLAASRLVIGNATFKIVLKTTYDEELREYAPGRVQLYKMLQYLADDAGPKRVEFYTRATEDQLMWATEERAIYHSQVFRWNWLGIPYRTVQRLRGQPQLNRLTRDSERS